MDISKAIKGVILFFFGFIYTVVSWYTVPMLMDYLPTTTLKAIVWIGLITTWILAVIVTPAMMIIDSTKS